MILFEKVRWKNFLSTGNVFSEIDLQRSRTNLIVGHNGSGKSTILDALTFSLFGKPFRKISKSMLVNSVNEKDTMVEVEFSIGKNSYHVIRGIKPNKFIIYCNGQPWDEDAKTVDQQKNLEQNVLKMNFKSFTQIVVLGSSTFVPFMQLSSSVRRDVIEDLLDIRIFSFMNNLLKDKLRIQKEQVRSLNLKRENLEDKIKMQDKFLKEIENRSKEDVKSRKQKINYLIKETDEYVITNEELELEVTGLNEDQEKFVGADKKLSKLNNFKGQISNKVSNITKEHKFFKENTVCPTCTQHIEEDFRLNKIKDAQSEAKKLKKGFEDLEKTIEQEKERERQFVKLTKEITKLNNVISKNNTHISINQKQIRELESEIQTITEQFKNRNTEHEKLEEFNTSLKTTDDKLSERNQDIVHHDFAYSLLKDDGVKTKIIRKYLPLINKQVNRYLQMMDFYINFKLDEEFNETVESPIHEDFSYSSFSEGEKMRIDLALLFTWREVARVKNSVNTNLLIMDEVFDSSLDGFGVDEFMKIIRFIIKDANIFVISHKSDLHDKFDNLMKFDKVRGFSRRIV